MRPSLNSDTASSVAASSLYDETQSQDVRMPTAAAVCRANPITHKMWVVACVALALGAYEPGDRERWVRARAYLQGRLVRANAAAHARPARPHPAGL